MPSFGGEVKPSAPCRSFAACGGAGRWAGEWHLYATLNRPFPRPYFPPSLVGRGAPLEMTGGTKSSGAQQAYRLQCIRAAKPWLRPHKEEDEEWVSHGSLPSILTMHRGRHAQPVIFYCTDKLSIVFKRDATCGDPNKLLLFTNKRIVF
jgi:hypothetical protein